MGIRWRIESPHLREEINGIVNRMNQKYNQQTTINYLKNLRLWKNKQQLAHQVQLCQHQF